MDGSTIDTALRGSASVRALIVVLAPIALASAAIAGPVLPADGQYVAGSGTIAKKTGGLTVNQSSNTGIIDWSSFSVGKGAGVQFNNGTGATLNRVTGGNLSTIAGSLKATGSLYLINPQGVIVSKSGRIITGGTFSASSRDVSSDDFMNGKRLRFAGTSKGNIATSGKITAGGDAILIGNAVSNSGTVSAASGTASLNAGNNIYLAPAGSNGRILVSGGSGSATNSGAITAAQAQLNAAGGNVYALSGNNGGIIRATGTKTIDGHVWLTSARGNTVIDGSVSATNADGSGGAIEAHANNFALTGDIDASARTSGHNGGTVDIISKNTTKIGGTIAAFGASHGKGGFVETSGHNLSVGGEVRAGNGGKWLLDPFNLTVNASAAKTIDGSLNHGTSVTLKTTSTSTSGPGSKISGPGDIIVGASLAWSGKANLTLDAYHNVQVKNGISISNTGAGNLVLAADTSAHDSGTVVFSGTGKVNFAGSTGNVTIYYHPTAYSKPTSYNANVTLHAGSKLIAYMTVDKAADLQAMNGNLTGIYALNTNINASSIANFVPIGSNSSDTDATRFNGTFDGRGFKVSNLKIRSNAGYVGLFGGLGTKSKVRNLTLSAVSVTGTVGGIAVGALAGKNEGLISSVHVGGSVTGSGDVIGGLVGDNGGTGTLTSTSSQAVVTDNDTTSSFAYVGGLAGENYHSIVNSYATNTVTETAGSESDIGGLVGWNNGGSISGSHALGNVTTNVGGDYDDVGGLAGRSGYTGTSTISSSYATGTVNGGGFSASVGGLVGAATQISSVSASHATGNVNGAGQFAFVGGLIGDVTDTTGSVSSSQASGSVTGGIDSDDGGLIGANAGTVSGSTASGSVNGGSGSCIGALIGYPGGAGAGCE